MHESNFTVSYKPIITPIGTSGETKVLYDEDENPVGFVISTRYRIDIINDRKKEYNYLPYEVFKSFNISPGVIEGFEEGGVIATRWTNINDLDVVGTPIYTQGAFQNAKEITFIRHSILDPSSSIGGGVKVTFTIHYK